MQPFSSTILRAISIAMTVAGILLRDTMHEDEDLGMTTPGLLHVSRQRENTTLYAYLHAEDSSKRRK